jgi:DNA polymerase-3 subunit alpha
MGIEVLPPDVNISEERFSVQRGAIRFGLEAVKGVGHGAVQAIVEAREAGPFRSLFDFCERVDSARVNRKCIENLILAGALDALGGHRAQQLEAVGPAMDWAARARRERSQGQESLFGGGQAEVPREPALPLAEPWQHTDLLRREKEALGFYVSGHPLDEHRAVLERLGVVPVHLLESLPDNELVLAAGLPALIRKSVDKRGGAIAFLTLEDFTSSVECLVFNDAYQQCGRHLDPNVPLLVKAKISTREDQKPKLRVEEAVPLADIQQAGQLTLHLALPRDADDDLLDYLTSTFSLHPGSSPVWFHVDHRSVEGVQMRLRTHRVDPCSPLIGDLARRLGTNAVRLTVGEPKGARSQEIFLVAR